MKKLSQLSSQNYFKSTDLDIDLYNLNISDTVLFIYTYHFIGTMIDDWIFIEKLVGKIKNSSPAFDKPFESKYFSDDVVGYANNNLESVKSFVNEFITDFEKEKEPFILETSASVKSTHYARTTKENFGYTH